MGGVEKAVVRCLRHDLKVVVLIERQLNKLENMLVRGLRCDMKTLHFDWEGRAKLTACGLQAWSESFNFDWKLAPAVSNTTWNATILIERGWKCHCLRQLNCASGLDTSWPHFFQNWSLAQSSLRAYVPHVRWESFGAIWLKRPIASNLVSGKENNRVSNCGNNFCTEGIISVLWE